MQAGRLVLVCQSVCISGVNNHFAVFYYCFTFEINCVFKEKKQKKKKENDSQNLKLKIN